MLYICNAILAMVENGIFLCNYVDGVQEYYAKQNNLVRERFLPYGFTPMWNVRNKTHK